MSFPIQIPDTQAMKAGTAVPALQSLDAQRIRAGLGDGLWTVRVEAELDSTNTTLLEEARAGKLTASLERGPVLLAAERQHAGRGRGGRSWHAAPKASLTCSIAWLTSLDIAALSGLSLACGLAVRDAVLEAGVSCAVKWPNDILVEGHKLAGLLLETCTLAWHGRLHDKPSEKPDAKPRERHGMVIIIGVGINVAPDAMRDRALANMALRASDLQSAGASYPVDRNVLAARLARAMLHRLRRFEQEGFAGFVPEWNAAHAWNGQTVRVTPGTADTTAADIIEGTALGVDALGRLRLQTPQGELAIVGGDVSLRLSA